MNIVEKKQLLPSDAVEITESDALKYQWDIIKTWPKSSETWALRYGVAILSASSSLSAFYINDHMRSKVRLGTYGHFGTFIPVVFLCGGFTALFHFIFVTNHIVLQKKVCPICYEIRSASLQGGVAIVYPLVFSPLVTIMTADKYGTVRIPSLIHRPMEVVRLGVKLLRPIRRTLMVMGIWQLFLAAFVTNFELKNFYSINRELTRLEILMDSS